MYFRAALPKALENQFTVFCGCYKIQLTRVCKCWNKLTNIAVAETEDLTAKNTILLEKLIVSQLVENFPALYGAQRSLARTQNPPVINQVNLTHAPKSYFFNIHFIITLPSSLKSSKSFHSFRFPRRNLVCIPLPKLRASCPVHLIFLDLLAWIFGGAKYKLWSSLLCNFLQFSVNLSISAPNTFLSTLF